MTRILLGIGGALLSAGVTYLAKDYFDKQEHEAKDKELAKQNQVAQRAKEALEAHKEHTEYLLALTALGVSMARVDGKIDEEEIKTMKEYINGVSGERLPRHIKEKMNDMIENPPTFNEAMEYLDRVEIDRTDDIRNLLVMVMEADDNIDLGETSFLKAFDMHMAKRRLG